MHPIHELVDVLTRDPLTPADAAAALTASADPVVRTALITSTPSGGVAYATVRPPEPIPLDDFESAFGKAWPAPLLHPGDRREILFYPEVAPDRRYSAAIIARAEAGVAMEVVVRRDAR